MVKLVECHRIAFDTKRLFERLGINQKSNPKILGIDTHDGVTILTIQRDAQNEQHMKMTEEEIIALLERLCDLFDEIQCKKAVLEAQEILKEAS